MKTNFDRSLIMKRAWQLFKNQGVRTMENWSMCLKKSWAMASEVQVLNVEGIYKIYQDQIYHFILSSVKNSDDAMDIMQDTFLKVTKNLHLYDSSKSQLSTWLYTIAKNTVRDFYRKDNSNSYVDIENEDKECNHEYFVDNDLGINERQNIVKQVEQAIAKLKPSYKEVARMFFIEDMSYKDIVNVLNIPENTLKVWINRIRGILQPVLQDVA